jgi:tetratricopeptide (TPR) repeat protein
MPFTTRRVATSLTPLFVVALLASPAVAEPKVEVEEVVLRTRLEDAAKAGRWGEVTDAFQQLRRRGLAKNDLRLLVRYAEAQAALGDEAAAETSLEEVLRARPDHVVALPLLARLCGRRGDLARATELLVLAARAGRAVLADLAREPAQQSALRPLLDDPRFVLRVLNASQGAELEVAAAHDPFLLPPGGDAPIAPPPPPQVEDPAQTALRRELEALFERVLERAAARDVPGVERAFGELRALLGRSGTRLAAEELEALRARFADAQELFDALRLQVLLEEGNGHLRAARAALDASRWDEALAETARVEALAARLRETDRSTFTRAADALTRRAREVARHAETARTIAGLRLEVTGIVLPPPGEPRRAIVNDRVHDEGDRVVDPRTGQPIDDLVVVEVKTSVVRFRYRDTEFARPLKTRL